VGSLSLDPLLAHAKSLESRIKAATDAMGEEQSCGVGHSDEIALLTAMDFMKVDVILESGTAGGRSTELMARFFQDTNVQITTVDVGKQDVGGRCARKVADTHERLRPFSNVKALIGDSSLVFETLLRESQGKRVGLFIDGPKGLPAVRLCMNMLKLFTNVQVCLFHDVLPPTTGRKSEYQMYQSLHSWGRTIAMTCCDEKWLSHFGLEYGKHSSMGIVAGTGLMPLGAAGDF